MKLHVVDGSSLEDSTSTKYEINSKLKKCLDHRNFSL